MEDPVKAPPELPALSAPEAEVVRKTAGQRHINLIWEWTQAIIAVMVTLAMIYSAFMKVESQALSNAFTLIIAIYFVRMNHTKTGGVGVGAVDSR